MRSLGEVLSQIQQLSLSSITQKYGSDSLRTCLAERDILDFFRRTGGKFGPLGPVDGDLQQAPDGSFRQNHLLGDIRLQDIDASCDARQMWQATVTLAGVRCFAAQDVETDELYGMVSLINVNPNRSGDGELVKTVSLPLVDASSRDTYYKETVLGNVPLTGSGIVINTVLWDNESGNLEEIRDKVEAALREGTKKAASALAAGAIADDPSITAGTVGEVAEFEIGGIKPFHILTFKLADLIAHALADDLLGERSTRIPSAQVMEFSGAGYHNSLRGDPALEFDVRLNWPPPSESIAFDKGGALYKAYFKVEAFQQSMPCDPHL